MNPIKKLALLWVVLAMGSTLAQNAVTDWKQAEPSGGAVGVEPAL